MPKQTPIVNIAGDFEETLLQYARHLGKDKVRRQVFDEIYGRKNKPRSAKQIISDSGIPESKRKQVLNALDLLSRHSLIEKLENDGRIQDGSRFLYKKIEVVRANKIRIINLADNRELANRLPTKRRHIPAQVSDYRRTSRAALRRRKKLTVLYLTASPELSNPLRVDAEMSSVQQAIRGSKFRDNISIEYRPAANFQSVLDGLNDCRPNIVHFSGHGDTQGLAGDNQSVVAPAFVALSFDILAQALKATDVPPDVVVLNSCESSASRHEMLKSVKVLVSMRKVISDIAAAAFAPQFYSAIASGQSIQTAFNQGALAVKHASISEADTPELYCAPSVDAASLILT